MKTSVEINGYTISIEESEGVISVNAVKDDEVVEEFTIQIEEGEESDSEFDSEGSEDSDIRKFGDFEEEEDFGGSDEFESEDEDDESEEESEEDESEEESEEDEDEDKVAPEGTLESFQSFLNKKRK